MPFFLTLSQLQLLRPFMALVLIGLLGRWLWPHSWPLTDLAHMFFDALVVSGFVGATIEIWAAGKLIGATGRELVGRLAGYGLPPQLQEQIRDIVATRLVIERYERNYSIEESGEAVLVTTETRYLVRNYSTSNQSYRPMMAEEGFHRPDFQQLTYGLAGRELLTLTRETLVVETGPGTGVQTVRGPEALTLGPRDAASVVWRILLRMPREYSDVISFGGPAVGATIRLARMPDGFVFNAPEDGRVPGGEDTEWVYTRGFTVGQHIRVWWFPPSPVSAPVRLLQ